jgi:hypothetical protein
MAASFTLLTRPKSKKKQAVDPQLFDESFLQVAASYLHVHCYVSEHGAEKVIKKENINALKNFLFFNQFTYKQILPSQMLEIYNQNLKDLAVQQFNLIKLFPKVIQIKLLFNVLHNPQNEILLVSILSHPNAISISWKMRGYLEQLRQELTASEQYYLQQLAMMKENTLFRTFLEMQTSAAKSPTPKLSSSSTVLTISSPDETTSAPAKKKYFLPALALIGRQRTKKKEKTTQTFTAKLV